MNEPVFVAFATQKGGAGKSTLTALTASYLYYLEGVDVMVIDCDDRQHSQKDYRENDLNVTGENPYLKKSNAELLQEFREESIRDNPLQSRRGC